MAWEVKARMLAGSSDGAALFAPAWSAWLVEVESLLFPGGATIGSAVEALASIFMGCAFKKESRGSIMPDWVWWSVHQPLRIFLRLHDMAVAHVDDAVAVLGGLGIMRDHQHRLT